MTNKEYSDLNFHALVDSSAAAKIIHEKEKEGWVKSKRFEYDATTMIYTYFFEREIKNEE